MNNLDMEITFENGKYKVDINGSLEYDFRDFSKVQEHFEVDICSSFADAVRKAFVNNKYMLMSGF